LPAPFRISGNLTKKWRTVSPEWRSALPHLVILFGDRFTP
jgi:hypothetical protein